MKPNLLSFCVALSLCCISVTRAAVDLSFTEGFMNGGTVPDGNATGWFDSRSVSGHSGSHITDIAVTLKIDDGYTGDIYAYLSHGGKHLVLLNRLGKTATTANGDFGYSDGGLNIVLSSSAAHDVHFYQNYQNTVSLLGNQQLAGTWQPDGRNIDPLLEASAFDTATRFSLNSQFEGMEADGQWTLFIADLATGGGSPSIVKWGLQMEFAEVVVPEPSNVIVATLCLLLVAVAPLQAVRRSRR